MSATMSDELACMLLQHGLSPSPPAPRLQSICEDSDEETVVGMDETDPFGLGPAFYATVDYDDLDLTDYDDEEPTTTRHANSSRLSPEIEALSLGATDFAMERMSNAIPLKRVLFPPRVDVESSAALTPPLARRSSPPLVAPRPPTPASLRPTPKPSLRRARPVSPPRPPTPTTPTSPARKRRTRGASTSPKHAHGRNHMCMYVVPHHSTCVSL